VPSKIRALSSAELGLIAKELGVLVSSYFKNFYELKDGSFLITFSKERKESAVYISLAKTINLTEFREKSEAPTEFALSVRKRLEGSRVESVEQHESDRILVIGFSGKEQRKMIVEMFDRGNLLLLNNQNIIELVYSSRSFKERSMRKSMVYVFPQQRGKKSPDADLERLREVESGKFASLSKLLDSLYLEERSTEVSAEKSREVEELQKSIEKLRKQAEEMKLKGEECKKAANRIFERMNELNSLIAHVGKIKPKDADELRGFGNINVKSIDAKRKTMKVELD
jgi:predicted ribosome quality control (RQC) complex YloA/Tae2 family protein